jgi:uncharacterized lipoprotein YajG
MKTMPVLIACVLPSLLMLAGCAPTRSVIPDSRIPHQVAEETTVVIAVRLPDGRWERQRVRLPEGWWIASPLVVDP